jgi:hypothetical protein
VDLTASGVARPTDVAATDWHRPTDAQAPMAILRHLSPMRSIEDREAPDGAQPDGPLPLIGHPAGARARGTVVAMTPRMMTTTHVKNSHASTAESAVMLRWDFLRGQQAVTGSVRVKRDARL